MYSRVHKFVGLGVVAFGLLAFVDVGYGAEPEETIGSGTPPLAVEGTGEGHLAASKSPECEAQYAGCKTGCAVVFSVCGTSPPCKSNYQSCKEECNFQYLSCH